MNIIELKKITKIYGENDNKTIALDGVSLNVEKGEFLAIMGPSGSGKSTLLNVIGCMDTATDGQYILDNREITKLSDAALSEIRNKEISFVFQNFLLLNNYNALENIILPLNCRKMSKKEKLDLAHNYMEKLNILDIANKKPSQISGGQRQRVAIARALVTNSNIILADEPTGALDSRNGEELMEILGNLNSEGKTIVMVTHNERLLNHVNRVVYIEDGKMIESKGHIVENK